MNCAAKMDGMREEKGKGEMEKEPRIRHQRRVESKTQAVKEGRKGRSSCEKRAKGAAESHFFARHQRNGFFERAGMKEGGREGAENISEPDLRTDDVATTSVSCYGPNDLEIPLARGFLGMERERERERGRDGERWHGMLRSAWQFQQVPTRQ